MALLLVCLVSLTPVDAQGVSPTGDGGAGKEALERVDLHALASLKQAAQTYKAMQSFATDFEAGEMDRHGHVSFTSHAQFA